jgi:hypothetical protein
MVNEDRLQMTSDQRAEIERDRQAIVGINRANVVIVRILGRKRYIRWGILIGTIYALAAAGMAPKRW